MQRDALLTGMGRAGLEPFSSRLLIGAVAAIMMLAALFVGSALTAVHVLDTRSADAQRQLVVRLLNDQSIADNLPSTGHALHVAGLAGLTAAHLGEAALARPDEVLVPLPLPKGLDTGIALIWTPQLIGSQVFSEIAPLRLTIVGVLLPIIGLGLLRFRAFASNLERQRHAATELASRDSLTGLGNRLMFSQRLAVECAQRSPGAPGFALLLLDLNGFKGINDTFGHGAGDAVLVEVADRLRRTVEPHGLAVRLGGDEFAVIFPLDGGFGALRQLAHELHHVLSQPHFIQGRPIVTAASIGIALSPAHGDTDDALLRHADAALYRAKAAPDQAYFIFEPPPVVPVLSSAA